MNKIKAATPFSILFHHAHLLFFFFLVAYIATPFKIMTKININNPKANNRDCNAGPPPSANILAAINDPNDLNPLVATAQKP
jgi:hypothetical protein